MELQYRPCDIKHLAAITAREEDYLAQGIFLTPEYDAVLKQSFAISGWAGSKCMGAAGVFSMHAGKKAMAWALLSKYSGPYMLDITRTVRRYLDNDRHDRIEMYVQDGFTAGHRWAKLLGFECETPNGMRKHGISGATEFLYARIK